MGRHALETSEQYNRKRARRILVDYWLAQLRVIGPHVFCGLIGACIGAIVMYAAIPVRYSLLPVNVRRVVPIEAASHLQLSCAPKDRAEYEAICKARGKR